ncbi:SDR family NAD(P)-dependent oxidoreductase [Solimicrobium silvestre]|uniref:Short-chain alcohol dehydrogenase n=1 Tax=Solimicrobium silvestre TaxID=2099400 RepID=A0A2S9H504_9BURK|nr:SDR family NAD(P)-dependent oxidoreductase [Solimicrobium silvestre]PRC95021.1 Short-chain alcohol dehydrogenase [Solimicrobium silvestre]
MQNLSQKVAVITGAAEGIGKAIALACAAEGMKLVLADIDADKLAATVAEISARDTEVIGQVTDVSKSSAVDALADAAFARFGQVNLLVNNAGVAFAKNAWETTEEDWNWLMGINLYGVTHALRAFIPRMLAGGADGHIVNTASIAGLISEPSLAAYNVSKFGVVTLSEGLQHDLVLRKANINVSVLCPGWVNTRIIESERHRASEDRTDVAKLDKVSIKTGLAVTKAVQAGMSAEQVASATLDAVKHNQFYILTHPYTIQGIEVRMQDILQQRAPTLLPL